MKNGYIGSTAGSLGLIALLFSATALGAPGGQGRPDHAGPPEHAGPPGFATDCEKPPTDDPANTTATSKVLIAHCGCNEAGTDLTWKHISVSTRAIGHLGHQRYNDLAPREVGCEAVDAEGTVVEILHKRAADDCRLVVDGNENNIGSGVGLVDCPLDPAPVIGESCSIDGPQEVPLPELEEV